MTQLLFLEQLRNSRIYVFMSRLLLEPITRALLSFKNGDFMSCPEMPGTSLWIPDSGLVNPREMSAWSRFPWGVLKLGIDMALDHILSTVST
jgi:hypothetical protein